MKSFEGDEPPAAKISGKLSLLQSKTATPPPTKWFHSP